MAYMLLHLKNMLVFSFLENIRVVYKLNMRTMKDKANTVKYNLYRNIFNISMYYTPLALTILSDYFV